MSIKSSQLSAVVVIGSALVLGGCGTDALGPDEAGSEDAASLATQKQEVYSGWTALTSDEYPPINCDGGSLISGIQCYGDHCDNMRIYCTPTAAVRSDSYWTPTFSEESYRDRRTCLDGYWVTGIACSGDDCDNVSLQCTYMSNITAKNCYWTGWMSEENGGYLSFGSGYYPRGAQCSGSYCDNLRYYVCQP